MRKDVFTVVLVLVLAVLLTACGAGEETTISGMVVSVNGTVVSLMETDGSMGGMSFGNGQMPEGMEGFQGFGNFDPEDFGGMFSGDGSMPQWGSGEMPQMPEGMTVPDFGNMMPNFGSGEMPDFDSFSADMETKDVDIGNAHISVEFDGGKASGSMADIKTGVFITVTMNGKGEVTNVLVSSQTGFSIGSMGTNT